MGDGNLDAYSDLHQKLMANEDYRIQFADRVQSAFFNDGAMSVTAQLARLDEQIALLDQAIIGESASWGDAKSSTPRLRSDWINATNTLRNHLIARQDVVIDQFKNTNLVLADSNGNFTQTVSAALFPDIDAPIYQVNGIEQHGGTIVAGATLNINAGDQAYYTVDGSDPRLPGGAINPSATLLEISSTESTIFRSGALWRYDDTGTDLGTSWQSPAYNDSGWSEGASELGYGESDHATTVSFGGDANDKHITTYFRKTVHVPAGDFSRPRSGSNETTGR